MFGRESLRGSVQSRFCDTSEHPEPVAEAIPRLNVPSLVSDDAPGLFVKLDCISNSRFLNAIISTGGLKVNSLPTMRVCHFETSHLSNLEYEDSDLLRAARGVQPLQRVLIE